MPKLKAMHRLTEERSEALSALAQEGESEETTQEEKQPNKGRCITEDERSHWQAIRARYSMREIVKKTGCALSSLYRVDAGKSASESVIQRALSLAVKGEAPPQKKRDRAVRSADAGISLLSQVRDMIAQQEEQLAALRIVESLLAKEGE